MSVKKWTKKQLPRLKNHLRELEGGHTGTIFKSKFTHDSKYLVSCGSDGLACLWDLNRKNEVSPSKSLVCAYSGHLYPCWDVEIFSKLNFFSTSSKDCTAKLWSFDRIYPLRSYCGHQSDVNTVRFHPNGSYLATGSSDKTVRLWSVQTSEFVRLFSGHRSRVFSVEFSPDGNYLASAGEDRKIKIWDLKSGTLYKEFKGHVDIVHALKFDNNSEILCSGGLDKTVKFWDVHQKNLPFENETFLLNSRNDTLNSSKSSSKFSTSSISSNELIRSVDVDFQVHSIDCDIQNVFYFMGVLKQPFRQFNNLDQPDISLAMNNTLNSAVKIDTSISKNLNTEPSTSSENFGKNFFKTHSIQTKDKLRHKVTNRNSGEPQLTASSSSPLITSSRSTDASTTRSKSTINTRRRTALAAHNSPSISDTPPSAPSSSSYLFSNNDDLYEV
jgi:WD40 repeat protein